MHRFFIEPGQVCGDEVTLSPEQAHQIARVLRLSSGARVCVLDGRGRESEAVLMEVSPRHATARALEWQPATSEPRAHVALALGLLKGEKMDWAVQKATEVGAAEILPIQCARSVVRVDAERATSKVERWQRIAREAAEQCRRGRVPVVHPPLPLDSVLARAAEFDRILLADEAETVPLSAALSPALSATPPRVLLLIGPEGSFAPEEAAAARAAGALSVSLGPRVLRAETAALVGTTLLLHHLEGE